MTSQNFYMTLNRTALGEDIHSSSVSVPSFLAGFDKIIIREIHAFSDASKDAIGATIYIRLF